ncbi:MAG: radical SAM protein [Archangiaceae bacterium]|nr:radical SAM protein [Archangiaceae bacterium]
MTAARVFTVNPSLMLKPDGPGSYVGWLVAPTLPRTESRLFNATLPQSALNLEDEDLQALDALFAANDPRAATLEPRVLEPLLGARVALEAGPALREAPVEPEPPAEVRAALPAESAVETRASVVLLPSASGWLCWSRSRGCWLALSLDEVRLLGALTEAQPPLAAAAAIGLEGRAGQIAAERLYSTGLLVDAVDRGDEEDDGEVEEEEEDEDEDEDEGLEASEPEAEDDLPAAEPGPVLQRAADAKIPVYSVYDNPTHTPLSLGMIVAMAKQYQGGALNARFHFVPQMHHTPEGVEAALREHGPGVFLFADYMWSSASNLEASRRVKALSPTSLTIHGGPDVPKYEKPNLAYLDEHPHIDVTVRGEGEVTCCELLEKLADHTAWSTQAPDLEKLSAVNGLTYRRPGGGRGSEAYLRTPDRARVVSVDELPSPYLSDTFDDAAVGEWVAAILETNRGCPYGCTFCDWGSATLSKIRKFSLERVIAEIEWVAKHRVPIIWVADANFGIFERDVEIAHAIAAAKAKYGYPKQFFVNYAKNSTERLVRIVRICADAQLTASGLLSIQTTDAATLDIIKRSNIKVERYEELLQAFRDAHLPITSDIMIGLPGSTLDSFKRDLQFFIDREVPTAIHRTRILPNSPMGDPAYLEKYQITFDARHFVTSTFSCSAADLEHMVLLLQYYEVFWKEALLTYWVQYLQHDHGIDASRFISDLADCVKRDPSATPLIAWAAQFGELYIGAPGGWAPFFEEIAAFTTRQYGLARTADFEVALQAQQQLLPDQGRTFPQRLPLAHDFAAYIANCRKQRDGKAEPRTLGSFGPAELTISDPAGLCYTNQYGLFRDRHSSLELESPLKIAHTGALTVEALAAS